MGGCKVRSGRASGTVDDVAYFCRRAAQHRALAAAAVLPEVRAIHEDLIFAYETRLAEARLARLRPAAEREVAGIWL